MDMRFIPVHDGRVPESEIREALAALPPDVAAQQRQSPVAYRMQASQPLCAPSLIAQDAYRHFHRMGGVGGACAPAATGVGHAACILAHGH